MCYIKVVVHLCIYLVLKMHELRIDGLEAILFTSSVTESVQFLNRFQRLQWLLKLMLKSVIGGQNKVVYNFIILLVLKFDWHKSDRLEVVLFTNSVTESVRFLYRFQRVSCLLKLMLQSVHGRYKTVVDAFLILLVLKFHNHRPDSLRAMNFTKWLLCFVHRQDRFRKLNCLIG
jgi:hypothetical protein